MVENRIIDERNHLLSTSAQWPGVNVTKYQHVFAHLQDLSTMHCARVITCRNLTYITGIIAGIMPECCMGNVSYHICLSTEYFGHLNQVHIIGHTSGWFLGQDQEHESRCYNYVLGRYPNYQTNDALSITIRMEEKNVQKPDPKSHQFLNSIYNYDQPEPPNKKPANSIVGC